jgi:hypothetical protein
MKKGTLPPSKDAREVDPAPLAPLIGGASGRAMQPAEAAALSRLVRIAQGDTGQSRRVADFLLAWWNAGSCGSFDLTTLWGMDPDIAADMVAVFALIARVNSYPDSLGYEADFKAIVRTWRPELAD